MPEKYIVKITQQAQEQIREIVSYIRFTLQAPETAMKMLDTLQEEIASLDQFPNRVPLTEEEPWHSQKRKNRTSQNVRKTQQKPRNHHGFGVHFWS